MEPELSQIKNFIKRNWGWILLFAAVFKFTKSAIQGNIRESARLNAMMRNK